MNQQISVSQFRQNVVRVLRATQANGKPCVIVRRSRPIAVILSPKVYRDMQKRLRKIERSQLLQVVKEGEREYRHGKARRLRSLRDLR